MLCEIAENYFQTLNPLAGRIVGDINNIKVAYENLWQELSLSEQEQIINETIFHPQVLLKYSLTIQDICGKGGCRFESGQKVIVDEQTGASWRDQFSAPFSWKSRSLLELCNNPRCEPALPPKESKQAHPPPVDNPVYDATVLNSDASVTDSGGSFSTFCARLKLIPGKSCGYQVSQDEKGFLSKIKNNAVSKLQSTFKIMGGRVSGPCGGEGDLLVVGGGSAVIVPRTAERAGGLAKPTSPPPPPPPRVQLRRDQAETPLLEATLDPVGKAHSIVKLPVEACADTIETAALSEDKNASDSESTMVPKSGFDFLDDW